ncbi:MAG: dephospho-CoA kinase [Candidatus Binataceae bacterium]
MITIGLTGGIGSGKSAVAKILAEFGAPAFDADKIAHSTYAPGGAAYDAVVAAFGDKILAEDRTVDRMKLGQIVFADSSQLEKLTSIVWPATFARMKQLVAEARSGGERKPIVIEAAVLIEAKWQALFDEIWLVTTSREHVIARIERDRGLKRAQTEARIRAQLSDHERRKHVSIEIANDGTIDELRTKIAALWKQACGRSAKP